MSLLAEEVVEEWLNRQGYFTIRGIRLGNDEIDILAIKLKPRLECRHIEVQVAINPNAYISKVTKTIQKKYGIGPNSAKKRNKTELKQCVKEWIDKKFNQSKKDQLKQSLCSGEWSSELVIHSFKHRDEINLLKAKVKIHFLRDIVDEMLSKHTLIKAATGNDLVDLICLEKK